MFDRERPAVVRALLTLSFLLVVAAPALAYGGPGAGVEFIGYFLSLLAWLGICFTAIILWPIRAFLSKLRDRKNQTSPESSKPQDAAKPAEVATVEK